MTLWTEPTSLLCPRNSPGKNTGEGSHSLLQGIFLNQGLKPDLLHCRRILYHESPGMSCKCGPKRWSFPWEHSLILLFLCNSWCPGLQDWGQGLSRPWGCTCLELLGEGICHLGNLEPRPAKQESQWWTQGDPGAQFTLKLIREELLGDLVE